MSIIPIFVPHAGCPHQCVFCNQKTISGQQAASVEDVCRQINIYRAWIKPGLENEAAFYGGSFTGLPLPVQQALFAPVDALLKQQIVGSVRLSTRPDYIDGTRLLFLRAHQVQLVELGVQSLDDQVLQAAGRGHTAAQVEAAVALLKDYGFQVGIQLMVGLPRQSFASLRETVAKVVDLAPDIARIYPLLVIKDTPLARLYAQGRFQPLTLEEAVEQAAYVYEQLLAAGIKVIRIGLQPDKELCQPGNIVAGPFHPAMGELVKSRVKRNKLAAFLQQQSFAQGDEVVLRYPSREESQVRGQKNSNVVFWQQLCRPATLRLERLPADFAGACPVLK